MHKTLFIHIGLHKTGSSSIQYGLLQNEERMASLGYYYPVTGRYLWGHHNIPWQLLNHPMYDSSLGTIDELASEIERCHQPNVVLSSEVFSLCSPSQIQTIARLFSRLDVRVLIYVRNQVDWLQSFWGEVAKGRPGVREVPGLRQWVDTVLNAEDSSNRGKGPGRIGDYLALANAWHGSFPNSITVTSFEKEADGGLFKSFVRLLGVKNTEQIDDDFQMNSSPSIETLEIVRRFRTALRKLGASESTIENAKRVLLNYDERLFSDSANANSENRKRTIYITESQYDRIVLRFATSNKVLSETYTHRRELFSFDKSKVDFGEIRPPRDYAWIAPLAEIVAEQPERMRSETPVGTKLKCLPDAAKRILRRLFFR